MPENHPTVVVLPQAKPAKPVKLCADSPLTVHPTDCWCRKIKSRIHYFGPWAGPDTALARYLEQKDDLHAGRTPRPDPAALTIKRVANNFLRA